MKQYRISFDNYIKVEHGYCVIPVPDEALKAYPDVYDRVCSIIYLAAKIRDKPDKFIISPKALSETMLRSSLSEFVSLEDFIVRAYRCTDGNVASIYETSDPILHMLKLLRNYNIHIDACEFCYASMDVILPDFPENIVGIQVPYISNLGLGTIKLVQGSGHYSDDVLSKMIECFEVEQRKYGIHTLIMNAAIRYSSNLKGISRV